MICTLNRTYSKITRDLVLSLCLLGLNLMPGPFVSSANSSELTRGEENTCKNSSSYQLKPPQVTFENVDAFTRSADILRGFPSLSLCINNGEGILQGRNRVALLNLKNIMTSLHLEDLNQGEGDQAAKWISETFPNLTALSLKNCNLSAQGVAAIIGLTKLTSLNLSHNPLGDKEVDVITENLPNLMDLCLKNCNIRADWPGMTKGLLPKPGEKINQRIAHILKKADIESLPRETFIHPLDAKVTRLETHLSDALKMKNIGIHLVRLKPGDNSTVAHFHSEEEEFIYILLGKGVARIGEQEIEVGPGDFLGFTAPSAPHLLKNPFIEDLVYLMGGERRPYDIIEYPDIKKKLVKIKNELITI